MEVSTIRLPEKILVINVEECTGCRICELICSFYREREFNPTKSRIHIVQWEREGVDVPSVCLHCEMPACETVCPTDAIYKDAKSGAVLIHDELCIGCKACLLACPFGGISIDLEKRKIIKCDLCGYDPRCVKFCPTGAIQFLKVNKAVLMRQRRAAEKMAELFKIVTTQ